MKNLFFCCILLWCAACGTTNNTLTAQKKLDSMFEKFDIEDYIDRGKKSISGEKNLNDFIDKDGFYIKRIGDDIDGYIEEQIPPLPYFYRDVKKYYPSEFIKTKGKYLGVYSWSVKIGLWYEFDEKGNLIKTINEDSKFGKFGYNELLEFINRKGEINLKTGKNRENLMVDFFYSEKTGQKLWHAFVLHERIDMGDWMKDKGTRFFIDGDTGKVIQRKDLLQYRDIVPSYYLPTEAELKKTTEIYKTYEGKNFTKDEWIVFEEKAYQEYLKKKNRR